MTEKLLLGSLLVQVFQLIITGYILLCVLPKKENEPTKEKKRVATSVQISRSDKDLQKALEKYDGGMK